MGSSAWKMTALPPCKLQLNCNFTFHERTVLREQIPKLLMWLVHFRFCSGISGLGPGLHNSFEPSSLQGPKWLLSVFQEAGFLRLRI